MLPERFIATEPGLSQTLLVVTSPCAAAISLASRGNPRPHSLN